MENKIIALTKSFEDEKIRTVWNKEEEKYYISIVDMIKVLTESTEPRKYWNWLKNKLLKEENFETSSITRQLKLKATDGKMRLTDVVDIEGMFRVIESIPSKKAEPIKLWLAHLGKERIDEEYDPEITINRALEAYRRKGYSDDWINQRLKAIDARKEFTDELKNNGIESSKDFAILTDLLTKTWSGYSTKEYKSYKGLTKENLRDNMTNMELVLNMLAEATSTEIAKSNNEKSKENARSSVIEGGTIAKNTREQIERKTGKKIVTNINNKNIKQIK
ncbi:MAG: hypothetical protein IJ068_01225 [Bacilli bacterium]|nr:hypothetical protein [Bacilli bacterium]